MHENGEKFMRSREDIEKDWMSGSKDVLRSMIELLSDIRDLLLENSKAYSIDVKEEPIKKKRVKKK